MSQSGTPAPAAPASPTMEPGLSAGDTDMTNGGSENRALIFDNPLLRRETPRGFTFDLSDSFMTTVVVVCPVTKAGAVKSQPLVIAAPEGVRGILQRFQEFYEGTKPAIGLSKYPMMKTWYHESADSIMEAMNGVAMSPEAREYLMNGPCGIRKHAYLFSLMQTHPSEFVCDTSTDIESGGPRASGAKAGCALDHREALRGHYVLAELQNLSAQLCTARFWVTTTRCR